MSFGGKLIACVFAAVATAGVAAAQTQEPIDLKVDVTVSPNKAGTKAHPQGVKLDVVVHIKIPEQYDPPLVNTVDVWFPKGGVYNGARYPKCSFDVLNRKGPAGCSKAAIVGHGTGDAKADTVITHPKITIVNGGAKVVYFYTVLNNPARVQAPVVAKITKLSGRWSYKAHAQIPKQLQVVAGVPIVLQKLHFWGGKGDYIATDYCPPSRKWAWKAELGFTNGSINDYSGTVGCRP